MKAEQMRSRARTAGRQRRRAGRWAALSCLLAALSVGLLAPLALAQQDGGARPAPRPLFGIAGHAWWSDEHFDTFLAMYRDLGITGVRIPLDWKTFEPREGVYDFSLFDRVFPRLAGAGLELTVYFVTVPAWATSNPEACQVHEQEFCDFPPEREQQYRAAARAAIAR